MKGVVAVTPLVAFIEEQIERLNHRGQTRLYLLLVLKVVQVSPELAQARFAAMQTAIDGFGVDQERARDFGGG